jgi:hypothetical protein
MKRRDFVPVNAFSVKWYIILYELQAVIYCNELVKAVGGTYVGAVEASYTISQIGPQNKERVTSRRFLTTQRQKSGPAAYSCG